MDNPSLLSVPSPQGPYVTPNSWALNSYKLFHRNLLDVSHLRFRFHTVDSHLTHQNSHSKLEINVLRSCLVLLPLPSACCERSPSSDLVQAIYDSLVLQLY